MEEGRDCMKMSRDDFIALSERLCEKESKCAKLEVKYEMVQDDNSRLNQENMRLKDEVAERDRVICQQKDEIGLQLGIIEDLKAQLAEKSSAQTLTPELVEKAVKYLMQSNLLLSYIKMQKFMEEKVDDLNIASLLRAFVTECLPDTLEASLLAVVNRMMILPDKQKQSNNYNAAGDIVFRKHVDKEIGSIGNGGIGFSETKE